MGLDSMIDSVFRSVDVPDLVSETILPGQFIRPSAASSPERRLMSAVLEAALRDLRRSANRHSLRMRRLAADVDAWFASDDEGWPYSFRRICDTLGLDAAAVRTRVARRGYPPDPPHRC